MALRKDSLKLLRQAVKILNGANNEWVTTTYLSGKLGVESAKIRGVLDWQINNTDNSYIEWKKEGRFVLWRSNLVHKAYEPVQDMAHYEIPDGGLIDGIAEVLGNKEKYRQALLKIRQVIDDALGDVISH